MLNSLSLSETHQHVDVTWVDCWKKNAVLCGFTKEGSMDPTLMHNLNYLYEIIVETSTQKVFLPNVR